MKNTSSQQHRKPPASFMHFVDCLFELAKIKRAATPEEATSKTYSPAVEATWALMSHTKGWQTEKQTLFEDDLYSCQLWSDKVSGNKVAVILKSRQKEGIRGRTYFPVRYISLENDQEAQRIVTELAFRAFQPDDLDRAA